jgi:hypothetical protein
MVERRRWTCPKCGRRWDIPIGHDPKECPKCEQTAPGPAAVDSGERDFQSFFSRLVGEASTGKNGTRRHADRTVREIERPTSEEAFFVPLPTQSPVTDAVSMPTPVVGRKRKQRSGFPFAIVTACVAFFLLLGGLIAYQRATIRRAGTGATDDDEANRNSGLLARAVSAVLPDPDLTAVRAWLRDNLDDPKWEEVRWWPARDMTELKELEIKELRAAIAETVKNLERSKVRSYSRADGGWTKERLVAIYSQQIRSGNEILSGKLQQRPLRLCRLKYRTKNPLGTNTLCDCLFEINGDRATKASEYAVYSCGGFFPDIGEAAASSPRSALKDLDGLMDSVKEISGLPPEKHGE